jgi:hypothetical protein
MGKTYRNNSSETNVNIKKKKEQVKKLKENRKNKYGENEPKSKE